MASVDTVKSHLSAQTCWLVSVYQRPLPCFSTSVHVPLTSDWLLSGQIMSESCSASNEQLRGEVPQGWRLLALDGLKKNSSTNPQMHTHTYGEHPGPLCKWMSGFKETDLFSCWWDSPSRLLWFNVLAGGGRGRDQRLIRLISSNRGEKWNAAFNRRRLLWLMSCRHAGRFI